MKRLLAYLFIVLGLSLTFSVNAEAKTSLCIYKEGNHIHFERLITPLISSKPKHCKGYALEKKSNPKLYKRIKWHFGSKSSSNNYGEPWNINKNENHFNKSVEEIFYFISVNHYDLEWFRFVKEMS